MNRFKIEWECRRGMRELDKMIMPFYQQYFDDLSEEEQNTFVEMLSYSDPELFRWFMHQLPAPTAKLQTMVELIRTKLQDY
ncbi:succinate dehydrogenase assembly factor 2 [Otariodibacter sp.]|uniref:FAD assembly factor SdhE n=1 Tax=Otariodibacter sp. TaxID=3030919 RepID=UPI0026027B28|nr:succinate dehydrogenase assembly factor 2 [Otariodibacter sp.]